MSEHLPKGPEWGTFLLILICYGVWLTVLAWLPSLSLLAAVVAAGVLIAFHGSLTHEVLHGHPFRSQALNEALMFLPLNLMIPYNRFRDTHLAHHDDTRLTDPYDDPESNFQDPLVWATMPGWQQALLRFNNTLLGRILVGPLIGQACFTKGDIRLMRQGNLAVIWAWVLHVPGVLIVLWIVWQTAMPFWAYLLACYLGLCLLKIRTYLEHRAHDHMHARTVIVERGGLLAFLFLNNSLHVVHHMHPGVPWYRLPRLYREHQAHFRAANQDYVYRSYGEVFRQHFLRAKDPVPHPLWQRDK